MASILRKKAQTPAGSKYFVTTGPGASTTMFALSGTTMILHPIYGASTGTAIQSAGVVFLDLGRRYTSADLSSVSTGLTYNKVLPIESTYAMYYSTAGDLYVSYPSYDGDSNSQALSYVARLG